MNSIRKSWWTALAIALAAVVSGCDSPAPPSPVAGPSPAEPAGKPAAVKVDDAKAAPAEPVKAVDLTKVTLTDEQLAEIKKIAPPQDQKLAIEQKICPVSGDHLGEMGVPVKVVLKDQAVFLCCGGCVKEAKANPDAMLAKLGRK